MGPFIFLAVYILTISLHLNRTMKSLYEKRKRVWLTFIYISVRTIVGLIAYLIRRTGRSGQRKRGAVTLRRSPYHTTLMSHLHIPLLVVSVNDLILSIS